MLSRALRILPNDIATHVVTLLLACFYQLDVVQNARLLDDLTDPEPATAYNAELHVFNATVLTVLQQIINSAGLALVSGFLHVLVIHRVDFVAMSRPGLELLTMFLARAYELRGHQDPEHIPTEEELTQWHVVFNDLFTALQHQLVVLFPSTRIYARGSSMLVPSLPDQHVWQFLVMLAKHGDPQPHHVGIVAGARDTIMRTFREVRNQEALDAADLKCKDNSLMLLLEAVGIDPKDIQL